MAARKKTDPAAPETLVEKVADICRACWPHGWPHLSRSASCEHGEYSRPDPAGQAQQPKAPPTETPETPETPDGGASQTETQPPAENPETVPTEQS